MAWKKIAGVGIAASAGVGLLIAAVNPANAAGDYPEKAFALQVKALGKNVLAPTPYVESPNGDTKKERVVSIPARDNNPTLSLPISDNAPVDVGVLEAVAEKNHAHARVAGLNLGGNGGITAKAVTATCKKAEGTTEIANLQIVNNDLSGLVSAPNPNTKIGVPGLLEITLNEQNKNADGSLTVNAVHVAVAPDLSPNQLSSLTASLNSAGGLRTDAGMTPLSELDGLTGTLQKGLKKQARQAKSEGLVDVVVASATCGNAAEEENPDTPEEPGGNEAPTPTPVTTQHAVTG